MGQFRDAVRTAVTLPHEPGSASHGQPTLLDGVKSLCAGEFEVLGVMGRDMRQQVVYLAHDRADRSLVVLKLEPGQTPDEYTLCVVEKLDASIPAPGGSCPSCGISLRGWGRYCHECGADVSGLATGGSAATRAELMAAVVEASRDQFEVLGQMVRADGGGRVYFARDLRSGALTALKLERSQSGEYQLGVTGVLSSLARRVGKDTSPS